MVESVVKTTSNNAAARTTQVESMGRIKGNEDDDGNRKQEETSNDGLFHDEEPGVLRDATTGAGTAAGAVTRLQEVEVAKGKGGKPRKWKVKALGSEKTRSMAPGFEARSRRSSTTFGAETEETPMEVGLSLGAAFDATEAPHGGRKGEGIGVNNAADSRIEDMSCSLMAGNE
jgi:hypothetical protein